MTTNNNLKTFKKGQKVLVRADKDHPWIEAYYVESKDTTAHYVLLSYHGFIMLGKQKVKDSNILPLNNITKHYIGIVGGPEYEA